MAGNFYNYMNINYLRQTPEIVDIKTLPAIIFNAIFCAGPSTIYHPPSTLFSFGEKHLFPIPSFLNFALPFVPGKEKY
jgi:hypothetical protein